MLCFSKFFQFGYEILYTCMGLFSGAMLVFRLCHPQSQTIHTTTLWYMGVVHALNQKSLDVKTIQLPAFEFVKVTHPNTVVAPNSSRSSPTPNPSRPRRRAKPAKLTPLSALASWPKGCWQSGYWPTPLSRDRRCKGSPSEMEHDDCI